MINYTTNVRQKKKPATRRNRSEECIVPATNQTTTTGLSTNNENQCTVTFVGIIQDELTNQNIGVTLHPSLTIMMNIDRIV